MKAHDIFKFSVMTRSKGEYLCGKSAVPLKKIVKRQLSLSPLSRPERWMYISVWVSSVMYLCYSVLKTSFEREEELDSYYVKAGWKWIGRNKDLSDFEWDFWTTYLYEGWPWLLGHIPLAIVCRKAAFLFKKIKYIYTVYSAVVLCVVLGPRVFGLLIVHTMVIYLSALTSSVLFTWMISIVLVSTLNFDLFLTYMNRWLLDSKEEDNMQYLLMMFTTAMCNLRYTSFAVEMCWHRQKIKADTEKINSEKTSAQSFEDSNNEKLTSSGVCMELSNSRKIPHAKCSVETSPKSKYKLKDSTSPKSRYKRNRQGVSTDTLNSSNMRNELPSAPECNKIGLKLEYKVTDMWFYCFYLPLFCTGPLLTYDSFMQQWQKPPSGWSLQRMHSLFWRMLKVVWWAVFCQLVLHYFYFSALMSDEQILSQMSLWSLAGVGFCQGQFFMVKYVLLFGVPSCIALFDELQTPGSPCCISVVYLYSQMWKEFDKGFYAFIKRYIYIPLGGSYRGHLRRLFASFCCFSFIFIWHGAERDLFVWTMLNFFGVCLESVGSAITLSQVYQRMEETCLGVAWSQRMKGFIVVPLFSSSILAIFTFFKGTAIGYIYFDRLVLNGWPVPIVTVTVVLYCCVQTAIEINRWRKNRSVNVKQE